MRFSQSFVKICTFHNIMNAKLTRKVWVLLIFFQVKKQIVNRNVDIYFKNFNKIHKSRDGRILLKLLHPSDSKHPSLSKL